MNNKDDRPRSRRRSAAARPPSFVDKLGRALRRKPSTRHELIDVLRGAQKRGLLDRDALDMVEGVFQVSEMQVRDIMVPRAQMEVVDKNLSPEEYLPLVIKSGHSRFPMVDGDKDKVTGILLAKDLLRYFQNRGNNHAGREAEAAVESWPSDLADLLRPAVFVPESKRLNVMLREFRTNRNHMAIVVDEFGGVSGLVTIEDVLEQIVGEIADEHDIDADDVMILPRKSGQFVVKGLTPLDEFNDYFDTSFSDKEVDTVGGLVMTTLGHLPRRGEKVTISGLQFEVLHADSRRVHLLKVSPVAARARSQAE